MDDTTHTGGCLCGGVRYAIRGELRGVIACHCSQCRRTSGHHSAMTSAPNERLSLTAAGTLDVPTGIAIERHIFVAEKSDYYEIADALPKLAGRD